MKHLRSYKLVSGPGDGKRTGCWMSIANWQAGQLGWTDQAECVAPTIRALCIRINDMLSHKDRLEIVGPRLWDPMGTVATREIEQQRAYLCTDRAVRVYAPHWLDAVGKHDDAAKLRALEPIVDVRTAQVARTVAAAYAADAAAYAADAAAYAVAYAAYAAAYAADAAAYAADAAAVAAYAADAAADAAAYAAADAAYAAYAVAYAADAADAAAVAAYAAASRRWVVETWLLPLMYDLIALGPKTPIERVHKCKLECANA